MDAYAKTQQAKKAVTVFGAMQDSQLAVVEGLAGHGVEVAERRLERERAREGERERERGGEREGEWEREGEEAEQGVSGNAGVRDGLNVQGALVNDLLTDGRDGVRGREDASGREGGKGSNAAAARQTLPPPAVIPLEEDDEEEGGSKKDGRLAPQESTIGIGSDRAEDNDDTSGGVGVGVGVSGGGRGSGAMAAPTGKDSPKQPAVSAVTNGRAGAAVSAAAATRCVPSEASFNVVMNALAKGGGLREAEEVYAEMLRRKYKPSECTDGV